MALHGDNADLRELLRDPQVDVALKRALGRVLQATSSIMHRSQIRLRGHAAGGIMVLRICSSRPTSQKCARPCDFNCTCRMQKWKSAKLIWTGGEAEMPKLPSAVAMRRIVASDPAAQLVALP